MKRSILLMLLGVFAVSTATFAQGGFQRATVEERVKTVHEKLDSALKLDAAKLKKTDEIFTTYYTSFDKLIADIRSSGERPAPGSLREKMQPLNDTRDKELQGVLSEDEFKKWKDEIEPSLRPQRRNNPDR